MRKSKLAKFLSKKGTSQGRIAGKMKTITRPTLYKYENAHEKYTVEQISEMARLLGMGAGALMAELELIGVPTSYDLIKGRYVYA